MSYSSDEHDYTLLQESHVRAYLETDGETGYLWNGVPSLLLTTTGRRTGLPRTSAIIYGRDGDDYILIASNGGAPRHPGWFLNLQAQPQADIQVRAVHIPVAARAAGPADKSRLWKIMTDQWPNYDVYQTRTEREIPVVVLTPYATEEAL